MTRIHLNFTGQAHRLLLHYVYHVMIYQKDLDFVFIVGFAFISNNISCVYSSPQYVRPTQTTNNQQRPNLNSSVQNTVSNHRPTDAFFLIFANA